MKYSKIQSPTDSQECFVAPKHSILRLHLGEGKRSARFTTQGSIGLVASWLVNSFALPAQAAAVSIGNDGLEFNTDTTLESNFVESHGAYQSIFGVINLDTQEKTPLLIESKASDLPETVFRQSTKISDLEQQTDFRGTAGIAVPATTAKYTFKANTRYAFYLESSFRGNPTGIVYSTDMLNPERERQAKFTGNPTDLCSGGMLLAWDDTGSRLVRNRQQQDRDFDDFIVQIKDNACAMGGGELPPVATVPPGTTVPPVGVLPAVPAGKTSAWLWGVPLLAGIAIAIPKGRRSNDSPNNPGNPGNPGNPDNPEGVGVPEPLTILGTGTALGFIGLMRRRQKKND